jgi:hypothetical protein
MCQRTINSTERERERKRERERERDREREREKDKDVGEKLGHSAVHNLARKVKNVPGRVAAAHKNQ